MRKTKDILIDVLGVLFIITSVLLGWLPGPLGIPLFLIGLGLLAKNHEWAERWLEYAKAKGTELIDIIFFENIWIQRCVDLLCLTFLTVGVWASLEYPETKFGLYGIGFIAFGVVFGVINRKRYKKLPTIIKNQKRNKP